MKLDFETTKSALLIGGVAFIAYVAYRVVKKGEEIAPAVIRSVDITDSENLINRAASAIPRAVTGDPEWSFGGWLAETFSPTVRAANASLQNPPATPPVSSTPYPEPARVRNYTPPIGIETGYEFDYLGSYDAISAANPSATVNTSATAPYAAP